MKLLYTNLIFLSFILDCLAFDRMFLSICKAIFTTMFENTQYISIKPLPNISNKDVSLTIFKGNHITANNYIGISKTIQKIGYERGLNIDIKIPHYPFIKDIDKNNTKPSFILGHSSGVYDFLLFHNISNHNGLIQIGSVLNSNGKLPWSSQKLKDFPIPVLTLIGKKDGYLRHTYCLDEKYKQSKIEKYITKPIVIIEYINHLHISNTSSSFAAKLLGMNDFKSNINIETAWDILSSYIVDYINLNVNHKILPKNSVKRIIKTQKYTDKLLNTYFKFENIYNIEKLLKILYKNLLNNTIDTNVSFLHFYDFLLAKPTYTLMLCYIQKNNYFLSNTYFTPLWIKTKYEKTISAREINKNLFWQIAFYINFNTNYEIIFKKDKVCYTTLEWILSAVRIEKINNKIYIQSPIFITNNDSIIYKNYYYFKILSPAQILELINIDLQTI